MELNTVEALLEVLEGPEFVTLPKTLMVEDLSKTNVMVGPGYWCKFPVFDKARVDGLIVYAGNKKWRAK